MKIRILNNNIRLRLSQTDLQTLSETGMVSSVTYFPQREFIYRLRNNMDVRCRANFLDNMIQITVPQKELEQWYTSDKVSLQYAIATRAEQKLNILIEKDFKCLVDRPHEEEGDLFPNPNRKNFTANS